MPKMEWFFHLSGGTRMHQARTHNDHPIYTHPYVFTHTLTTTAFQTQLSALHGAMDTAEPCSCGSCGASALVWEDRIKNADKQITEYVRR